MADTVTAAPAPGETRSPRRAAKLLRAALDAFLRRREASVLLVAIGVMVYFQASTPIFLTHDNLRNIAQATGPTAIVAIGIVLLLVSGEIDVSVGMVAALAPYLMHYAIDFYAIPAVPAIRGSRARISMFDWSSSDQPITFWLAFSGAESSAPKRSRQSVQMSAPSPPAYRVSAVPFLPQNEHDQAVGSKFIKAPLGRTQRSPH